MLVNIDSTWAQTYSHIQSQSHARTISTPESKNACFIKPRQKSLKLIISSWKESFLPTRQSAKWLMISLSGEMCQQRTNEEKRISLLLVPKKGTYYSYTWTYLYHIYRKKKSEINRIPPSKKGRKKHTEDSTDISNSSFRLNPGRESIYSYSVEQWMFRYFGVYNHKQKIISRTSRHWEHVRLCEPANLRTIELYDCFIFYTLLKSHTFGKRLFNRTLKICVWVCVFRVFSAEYFIFFLSLSPSLPSTPSRTFTCSLNFAHTLSFPLSISIALEVTCFMADWWIHGSRAALYNNNNNRIENEI